MAGIGIKLAAVDETKSAFSSVNASMKTLKAGASEVQSALAGIGVGLSVGGFIAFTKGIIDGIDALNDLKDATGSSIENISALENVAKRTGTSMDTVGAALVKLNKTLSDAKPGSDIDKALKAIGLSAKGLKELDPSEALRTIAVGLSGYADDANKARLVQELFGKSVKDVAPLLKDLAESGRLVATVTTQQAQAAEDFNKQLATIKTNATDAARALLKDLIPALNEGMARFGLAYKNMGNVADTLAMYTRLDYSKSIQGNIDQAEATIKGLEERATRITSAGAAKGNQYAIDSIKDEIKFLKELRQQKVLANKDDTSDLVSRRYTKPVATKSVGALSTDDSASKAALAKQNAELKEQQKLLDQLSGVTGTFVEDMNRLNKMYVEGKLSTEQLNTAVSNLLEKQPAIKAAADEEKKAKDLVTKANEAAAKALEDFAKAQVKQLEASYSEVDTAQAAYDAHGKLASVLQEEALARLENARIAGTMGAEDLTVIDIEIANKKKLIAILRKTEIRDAAETTAKEAESAWRKAAEQIENSLTDALMRGFESGKGFIENLRDTVVNIFKTMVLRPTVSAIVNPISQGVNSFIGSTAGSAAGGTSGSGALGWLTGAGSAYGAFSGAASSGYALAAGGNAMATFSAGAEMVSAASGLSSAAAGMGQMMGAAAQGLTTALAAIPVWGWVALAVIAATQMKGDYVKSTGYADANFAAGSATGSQNAWIDRNGGYNPMDMFVSPEATKFVESMQQGYLNAAKQLGIGAVATTFGYSGNNADGGLSVVVGGTQGGGLYQSGEIKAADTAGLALASSRAIFTALQSSNMPEYLARVFNSITSSTASQQAMDNAIGFATALRTTRDALTETRTPLEILTATVNAAMADLHTSAAGFKTDFVAAIDSGLTPEAFTNWKTLETNIAALGEAAGTASRSVADIANERKTLQGQLDQLTMTSTQLLQKQRDALDESNRALFDQVKGFDKYNSLTAKFKTPETVAQATSKVTAAGFDVSGKDSAAIATYVTDILNGPGMKTATGELTAYGLKTVDSLTGVADSLGVLGDAADAYSAKTAEIEAAKLSAQQQIDILTGKSTQLEIERANALAEANRVDASGGLAQLVTTLYNLKDAANAAANAASSLSLANQSYVSMGVKTSLQVAQETAQAAWTKFQANPNVGSMTEMQATNWLADPRNATSSDLADVQAFVSASVAYSAALKEATGAITNYTTTTSGVNTWEQEQARQREKNESDFARLTDEMSRLSNATGYSIAARRRELSTMNAANQALQSRVWLLQDSAQAQQQYNAAIASAKGNLDSARAAVQGARTAVQSVQQAGTDAYLAAQQKVATAQQRIVDLHLEAARKLQDTGKSLREFVSGEIASAADPMTGRALAQSEFSRLLGLANQGDTKAYDMLSDAGRKLIDTSKEVMGTQDFEVVRRGVLRTISAAAEAADLAAKVANDKANLEIAGSANKDAMLEATLALTDAQLDVAMALEVANAINAPLSNTQRDLVAEFSAAKDNLTDAVNALTAAQAALNAIVLNTATMVTAVDNLTALQSTALSADATINFVLGSQLPQDLKDLAIKGSEVKTMVSFLQGIAGTAALSEAQMNLATGVIDMVNLTTNFIVGAQLPDDIKRLALLADNAIIKTTYDFLAGAQLDAATRDLALKASDELTRTINFAVGTDGLDESTRKIALNTTGDYTTLVKAALDPAVAPSVRDLILLGAGDYSATVKAIASSDLTTGLKNVLFNQTGDYLTSIKGVMDSAMDATTKGLLLGTLNTGMKSISLSATFGTALTTDQRSIINAVDQTVLKTVNAAAAGGAITPEQQAIFDAVGQGNTSVYKTLTASVAGGTGLTQAQTDLIRIASGATNTTVTLGGEVKMTAGTTLGDIFKAIHISGLNSFNMLGAIHNAVKILNDNTIFGTKFSFDYAPYIRLYDNQNYKTLGQTSTVNPAVSLGPTSPLYSALGNIFNGGTLQAFAGGGAYTNRLVNSPTLFDLGVMGESGPEAIMPLKRGPDGSLGVRAEMFFRGMHENLQGENMGVRLDRIAAELQATRKENSELRKRLDQILIESARTALATKQMATNGVQVFNEATEPLHTAA